MSTRVGLGVRMWWGLLAAVWGVACSAPDKPHANLGTCPTGTPLPLPTASASAAPPPFENPGGMWLPHQVAKQRAALDRAGLELDPAQFGDPLAAPLGAIVSLAGCSASFVSADGLVVTNHHCAIGALQHNSKPGQDRLEDGFLAKTRADEPSIGPTGRVLVTTRFEDVTSRVRDGLETLDSDRARFATYEKRIKTLVAECEAAAPGSRCEVASYFGASQFLRITKLELRDVRLVWAPPASIGNYGGEVDNWRWPRHTGDFTFFRAYVGTDGKPADFAAQNQPYRPKHHLKLASRPLAAGDFVMVAGYPGRTTRLGTAAEVEEAVDWWYPRRVAQFDQYLAAIDVVGAKDEDARLKGTPMKRGIANALTYTRGSLTGLTAGGALAARRQVEQDLRSFVEQDAAQKQAAGTTFTELDALFAKRAATRDGDALLTELERASSLYAAAITLVRMAEERALADEERKPEYQARNHPQLLQGLAALDQRYSKALDVALFTLAFKRVAQAPEAVRALLLAPLLGKTAPTDAAVEKAVTALFDKTKLADGKLRQKLFETAKTKDLAALRDPLLSLALALRPLGKAQEERDETHQGGLLRLRPRYVTALRAMKGGELAPDANGTLRVTYGTVRGYAPTKDAPVFRPFTTLPELVAKHTGKEPFDAPARLLEAAKERKFTGLLAAPLGELPVNFLADLDITGGNSGSATLNAKGELVGLAFDGNIEAMASDWLFQPEVQRSIHVDLRYLLWVAREVDRADRVLGELGVAP